LSRLCERRSRDADRQNPARAFYGLGMILELAILDVRTGETQAFESAFERAKSLIASAAGFEGLELRRCLEDPNRYVLLVRWARLEDHTEGFRGSSAYEEWRTLLHHFYDPFPVVQHYETVVTVS
jgi:heme-degrading monooxygenase HmoA